MNQTNPEQQREYPDIGVIFISPITTPEGLEHMAHNMKAIILIAYATGTTPDILNPVIKKLTESGTPVFLLSNNPKNSHGILRTVYAVQERSAQAGAIALQKVNINNLQEVLNAIQDELNKGKKGAELGEIIRLKFAYREDEPLPKAEWETPEGIADLQRRTEQMIRRQRGYHPDS
ncbi:hypothetical protein HZC21_00240 [Candidatus Peregrinibacteria bacterium]|nr:hypothetical protein [Candidatus Peregrinibacteria bacterium]